MNRKVLDINVAGARSGAILVDHVNGGTIVDMKLRGTRREIPKLLKNKAEVLRDLGSMNSGTEFGFGGAGGADALELRLIRDGTTGQAKHKPVTEQRVLGSVPWAAST